MIKIEEKAEVLKRLSEIYEEYYTANHREKSVAMHKAQVYADTFSGELYALLNEGRGAGLFCDEGFFITDMMNCFEKLKK